MDKPIAGSLEHARDLVRAVAAAGVRSQMFSMVRRGWARRARELIRSGSIGALAGIHCDLLFAKGPAGTAPPARRRERYPPRRFTFVDSKRELFTTGVYSIGLIRWLAGLEVRRVHALTANYFFAEHAANDVEDFAAALLELDGGVAASITAGRIGWTSHPGAGPMRLYLSGARGSAIVDAYRPRLEIADGGPPWTPPPRFAEDPMGFWSSTQKLSGVVPKRAWRPFEIGAGAGGGDGSDAGHFLDCIEAGRESDINAVEATRTLEALFACYRSAAEGRPVGVP
jgi:predicted dehydrogenase